MWEIYPDKNEADCLAIDGKKSRNTENNHNNAEQNSIMKVSIFSAKTKTVLKTEIMETKKQSEIHVAPSMVK